MTSNKNAFILSLAVSIAAFMEILDSTIVNVALHDIAGSLGTSMDESTWIITSYLVTNGMILPLSSWLSDRLGRKNFFILCIAGFSLSSLLCGLATSMTMLVVFRLLQGISGGGLQPSQQAIIKDSFPPEQLGTAFAITGIATVCAPIVGPVLGGYIVNSYSWRWIFFINVPVGIIAIFLVNHLIPASDNKRNKSASVDYIGMAFIALSIGCLQIALDNGQKHDWFSDPFITTLFVLAFLLFVAAMLWIPEQKHPIINLKLFKIATFRNANILMFFIGAFVNVTVMLIPLLVQQSFGYNAFQAGLILLPGGMTALFLLPFIAKISKKVSQKTLVIVGMLLSVFSMYNASLLSAETTRDYFIYLRILQVMGLPFLFVSVTAMGFANIPQKESNNASAIIVLMKNIGGSFGISLITSYLIHREQVRQAYLVHNITLANHNYTTALTNYTTFFHNTFLDLQTASHVAMAKIYQLLQAQAVILAYIDTFRLLMWIFVVLAILAFLLPQTPQPHHVHKVGETTASKEINAEKNS